MFDWDWDTVVAVAVAVAVHVLDISGGFWIFAMDTSMSMLVYVYPKVISL